MLCTKTSRLDWRKLNEKNIEEDRKSISLTKNMGGLASDVCQTSKEISDRLVSNNITLDRFVSLHEKYGDDIHLMFDCSTRYGDLAKVQNYFDDGIMDVDEKQADEFQQILKDTIPQFKEVGVSLFIWDGVAWYDDPRNMTAHTIIATPAVWIPFEEQKKSVAEWLTDAIEGKMSDYGVELIDKRYD